MWAGAGQADSTPAEFVRGADGGGGAGADVAAEGSTASHGVGNLVCFWFLEKKDEVSRISCLFLWLRQTRGAAASYSCHYHSTFLFYCPSNMYRFNDLERDQ